IETIGRRAYRSKDILTRRFRIGIDADQNPCTALPRRSNRICKRLAGGIAPLGADGIFEIDDDGVGPAFMRPCDEALIVGGDVEERTQFHHEISSAAEIREGSNPISVRIASPSAPNSGAGRKNPPG